MDELSLPLRKVPDNRYCDNVCKRSGVSENSTATEMPYFVHLCPKSLTGARHAHQCIGVVGFRCDEGQNSPSE